MKFCDYFRHYAFFFLGYLFFVFLFFLFFWQLQVELSFLFLFLIVFLCFGIFCFFYFYFQRKFFYDSFFSLLDSLEQKYLISEMDVVPNFFEAKKMMEAIYEIDKSMKEHLNTLELKNNDFKDYIELWIHEVKIPLSNLMLLFHNREKNEGKIKEQLNRLDNFLEQVLFYVRSETVEKDYLIHSCNLKEIVHEVVQKNMDSFLLQHINLVVDVNGEVFTDEKWMVFILNQILSNSFKYRRKKEAHIRITSNESENQICLNIWDDGCGILESDLPRVFDKSFTGFHGRKLSSSTGMGLYIVKNLIDKLGHHIIIESKFQEYTRVTIIFSKTDFYQVVQ